MSTKSKLALSETSNSKATPTVPRVSKIISGRGVAKSNSDSATSVQNARVSADRSPSSVTSKLTIDRRSSKLATPPDKKTTGIVKPSELQAKLNQSQEDLKKAKEKLVLVETEKEKALDELKEAHSLAEVANEKLKEALLAQKRAEENSEIENFRALEMEQLGIEAAHKEDKWQEQLEAVTRQHAMDLDALFSASEELEKVKKELAMTCDAKNQALGHADDATKLAEIHAEKVEAVSAELTRLKSELDSRVDMEEKLVEKDAILEQLKKELAMTCDAKDQALSHAEEATKLAEIHAEKVETMSAELTQLKSELDLLVEMGDKLAEKEIILEQLKKELSMTCDAKNQALSHANDAMKLAEINAEKVEFISAEMTQLKSELDSRVEMEEKLAEKESILEKLNVELEAAKMAESYEHNLMEELNENVKELASQAEALRKSEKSALESVESYKEQLERSNDLLSNARLESSSLQEKVGLLEISIEKERRDLKELEILLELAKEEASEMSKKFESQKSELVTVKEEKNQALNNEKVASATINSLLEEKNKLSNDLTILRDDEEKSKTALESLASALHEVSSEARDAKEKLLLFQDEHENYESQNEDLKLVLKATNEKYESMLEDSRRKIDALTNSNEQSKAEWEQKEFHLMNSVKKSEEEKIYMENEINRLVNLLRMARESESEVIYLKDVLGEAKSESMKLKEGLMDKENELHNIFQENEELRKREEASFIKVNELSKLLEEALTKKEAEEIGEVTDSEKDYDMLPKVVEFYEENGKSDVKPKVDPTINENLSEVNGFVLEASEKENFNNEKDNEDSAFKMWENCKIEEKHLELEQESFEDEVESKDCDRLSSVENVVNGESSPMNQNSSEKKKKKALLGKFGSLLKKKSSTSQR